MSTRRSAQIHINEDLSGIVQSMSLFIRNHRDSEQLLIQMKALQASGQLFEVSTLIQCVIDQYNDNIQNVDFFILAAQVEIELNGFTTAAHDYIRQALKIAPFNDIALAYYKMASACTDLKDGIYDKGEATLRRCIEIPSLRPYAGFLLAHHLFWKINAVDEALTLLEEAVQFRSSFLKAWVDLALAYKRIGERVKANHALQRCLQIDRISSRREYYERHIERQ